MSTEPPEKAKKRSASGQIKQDDLKAAQLATSSSKIIIASQRGVAIGGNVSGGMVGTFVLPPEALKLLQPPYQPPAPSLEGTLAERGDLPPGSRMAFLPNAVFTGRKEDLLELARILLHSDAKGVGVTQEATIATGFGGIGKTQLAVEFCYRYGRFFQGVHWIRADLDIQDEIAACGSAMELPRWPGKIRDQLSLTLKALQEGRPRLVVLDNVENSAMLQDWMPQLPNCRLLLTSRQSEWPPDLGLSVWPLDVLSRTESEELLRRLATRLRKVSDEELDDIANRLGDLPLALDLAGRYLVDRPSLSPKDYLSALEDAGNALEHTSLKNWVKHSPTKHATSLAATFSLSWDQLSQDETDQLSRRIFRMCGYCAPNTPIPLDLLKKAVNSYEMLDRAMSRLSSLGLITPTDSGPSLHPLLAEFARLQDEEIGELIILAGVLADLAVQASIIGLPEQMRPSREHLRRVAQFAEAAGLQKAGLLWNELGCHLRADAEYKDAKRCSARALRNDEKFCGPHHPTIAKRFNNLGIDLIYLGNPRGAKKCHQRAVKIEEENNGSNSPQLAVYLNSLGGDLENLGNHEDSRKSFLRALEVGEAVYGPNHPEVAVYVSNLGSVMGNQGDLLGAKKCFVRALKIDIKNYGPDHPLVAEKIEIQTRYAAELYNVDVRQDQRYMAERDLVPCGDKTSPGSL
jgi:tetratricopeptide (TPR) repeat protein